MTEKKPWKKLSLKRQTLRVVNPSTLREVNGGTLELPTADGCVLVPRPKTWAL